MGFASGCPAAALLLCVGTDATGIPSSNVFSILLMLPFFENGQQVIDATLLSMPGKAAAVINEKLLEMPQDENQLQKLVDGWDQLTDEDRTLIKDWLNENQLTFQNLQALLNSLKGE